MAEVSSGKITKLKNWTMKKSDQIAESDGKLLIFHFEDLFQPDKIKVYDRFFIKKTSYEKQLNTICRYLNFYMKFYDTDHELALAYLKLKYALDKEKRFDETNMQEFIDLIYELMFTPTVVQKIKAMVDDNYLDDIESSENSKKYVGNEKKHLESLEFTNPHIKILLMISFGMKMISPVMLHYITINVIKLDKDSDVIFNFYSKLFDIFSTVEKNEDGTEEEINMYNKLFVYVKAKVLESKSHNRIIFSQRDIFGDDEYTVIRKFLHKVIISENMVKFSFSERWDPKTKKYKENVIGMIKTVIKYQLMYYIKEAYDKNLTEVTMAKNADGLSGIDKMEMHIQKIDEGLIILSEATIKVEMERIMKDNDFNISEDEINYYIKNHSPSEIQVLYVLSYWEKYFGSYRNMQQIDRRDYIILMLILKKRLLLEAGADNPNSKDDMYEYSKLPYLLTGNVQDKVNTRLIRNNKFVSKVKESYLYKKLVEEIYSNMMEVKPDYILSLLSQIINTKFTYVSYEHPELLGKEIEYSEDKISDELLFFLNTT